MPSRAVASTLQEWCDLFPTADGVSSHDGADDLFERINKSWHSAHPEAPASLLRALGQDEERQITDMIERYVASRPAPSDPAHVVSRLHELFVTEFDPDREQRACQVDLERIEAARDEDALLSVLADATRAGYASPIHVGTSVDEGGPIVLASLHPAPLPPEDFDDDDCMAAYIGHMAAMVEHIGAHLSEVQLRRVVLLDRLLWTNGAVSGAFADLEMEDAETFDGQFDWPRLLERVVGESVTRMHVTGDTDRRMSAWWATPPGLRRDWMVCRLAYDLGPFVSEEALHRNSRFFAGRILGSAGPRPRRQRFVSFVKTAAPEVLSGMYVDRRHDTLVEASASRLVEDLRRVALQWVDVLAASGTGLSDSCVRHLSDRLSSLAVELGAQPLDAQVSADQGSRRPVETASSVCAMIRHARARAVGEGLAPLHAPELLSRWRVLPYTAAAYYQASTNKVVVPWALLRAPLIGKQIPAIQTGAVLCTLIAHEMAHAVLPARAADWPAFVEATGLDVIVAGLRAAADDVPGGRVTISHERELAADAIGFLWAHSAFATPVGHERIDPSFLTLWATRWRGLPTADVGFVHLDRHPPARLRCNLAPTYLGAFAELTAEGPRRRLPPNHGPADHLPPNSFSPKGASHDLERRS